MNQEEFVKGMVGVWGMSEEESEIAIKKARIDDLRMEVAFVPFEQFFDSGSSLMENGISLIRTATWKLDGSK